MRLLLAGLFAMLFVPPAARAAEDTRPPVISDVRAGQRGGQVHIEARITDETGVLMATCHHRTGGGRWLDAPMTKNDYDEVFKVSFSGGADTEFWIESSDLLGNGPSTYGAAANPVAVGSSSPPKEAQTQRETPPPPKHARSTKVASKAGPPVIEHRKLAGPLPEGKGVTLRARVHGDAPIAFSGVFLRKQGESTLTRLALSRVEGETYEAKIPGDKAHGNLEYLLAAKDENGKQSFGGDGSGGLGGFKAELPPQTPGAVYYQVVACDPSGSKCAVSTGSKRKWHAVAISPAVGAKAPAIDVPSSKAPRSLPE